ncbi:SPASM domain-containing protein, partial [Gammaproteobacteria bacterium]|nr:SPASM domain-containing protein [Gammaproteobacteria bacterium]
MQLKVFPENDVLKSNTIVTMRAPIPKAVRLYRKLIAEKFANDDLPLPRIIHLETRSRCNGACSFCLANIKDDPREDELLPDALIEKIINELSNLDYSNRLSFYNNNEPTLDRRLLEIITKARAAIPRAYLEIKSNGKGLNSEKVLKLFNAGLDMLYINDYTKDGVHSENIKKIKLNLGESRRFSGHFNGSENIYFNRLVITNRQVDQVLGARGGTAPNKIAPEVSLNTPCFRPFEMMTISPSGKVGVCSEDLLISSNMGNLHKQTISEIWMSKRYEQ